MAVVERHLVEDFAVPHVAVRTWGLPGSPSEFLPESIVPTMAILNLVEQMQAPFAGHHVHDDIRLWFGESAEHLKSYALVPLGRDKPFGLLALASENPQRFYPDMGSLFLSRIGEMVSAAIFRTAG